MDEGGLRLAAVGGEPVVEGGEKTAYHEGQGVLIGLVSGAGQVATQQVGRHGAEAGHDGVARTGALQATAEALGLRQMIHQPGEGRQIDSAQALDQMFDFYKAEAEFAVQKVLFGWKMRVEG